MSLQSFSPVPPGSPNLVFFIGQIPKKIDGKKRITAWIHVMVYRVVSEWASKHQPSHRTIDLRGQAKR